MSGLTTAALQVIFVAVALVAIVLGAYLIGVVVYQILSARKSEVEQ